MKVREWGRETGRERQAIMNALLSQLPQRVTKLDLLGKLWELVWNTPNGSKLGHLSTHFLSIGRSLL